MSLQDYEVREPRADEKPLLHSFLYEHSYNYLFNLYLEAHGKKYDDEYRRLMVSADPFMKDPANVASVVAVHRASGKICGVFFVTIRSDPLPVPTASDVQNGLIEEWKQTTIRSAYRIELFKIFPMVKRICSLRQLLVAKEHRQRGLGGVLLAKATELAKRMNAELVVGLFTSSYSKRIAEKAGFRSVADFDVADARNTKGEVVYPGVGSFIYSVMVKEL